MIPRTYYPPTNARNPPSLNVRIYRTAKRVQTLAIRRREREAAAAAILRAPDADKRVHRSGRKFGGKELRWICVTGGWGRVV